MYIVKHNHILGGMLFTIRKAQLHVSALNVGHLHVVQCKLISLIYMPKAKAPHHMRDLALKPAPCTLYTP